MSLCSLILIFASVPRDQPFVAVFFLMSPASQSSYMRSRDLWSLYKFFCIYFSIVLCAGVYAFPSVLYGGHMTTLRTQFSPCTIWVLGVELRLLVFLGAVYSGCRVNGILHSRTEVPLFTWSLLPEPWRPLLFSTVGAGYCVAPVFQWLHVC